MSWRDRKWKYADAEETREPGYLARKFAKVRREQEAKKRAEQEHKITSIMRKKAAA